MNVTEASKILGISRTQVLRLLSDGIIAGNKVGNRWAISQDAVDEYQATRRKPGRPPKKIPAYTLMNGPYEVADFAFDETDDKGGFDILEVKDPTRAPLFRLIEGESGRSCQRFGSWWQRRGIPQTRQGIEHVLATLGIDTPSKIHFKNNALSLSDQYWIKPYGTDLRWEDINYFDNDFADEDIFSNRGAEPARWLDAVGSNSPDNVLNGVCPKKWVIRDGVRTLLKGSQKGLAQQPVNEAVATALHTHLLASGEFVEYNLEFASDEAVCSCADFITRDEEFIPAWCAVSDVFMGGDKERDFYDKLVFHATRIGVDEKEFKCFIDKMLVCDFILANSDRHLGNFGFVRNIHTIDMRIAPLFDSGNCLWHNRSEAYLDRLGYGYPSLPFDENPADQLSYVSNWKWFDPASLDGFVEEARQILTEGLMGKQRADAIARGIEEQISFLLGYIKYSKKR